MSLPERMKFGVFLGPFHRVGENPTLAIDRDLELVDRINRGVLQSEVHSFPVPSVGASGSDKFPSARAFSSR